MKRYTVGVTREARIMESASFTVEAESREEAIAKAAAICADSDVQAAKDFHWGGDAYVEGDPWEVDEDDIREHS